LKKDSIMADRGMIQDLFTVKDVHVNTPTMLKEKTRLEPKDRRVAHKLIHSQKKKKSVTGG
jgi:hypothetical protein